MVHGRFTTDTLIYHSFVILYELFFVAVVTPITVSIGMAFRRREQALLFIARIRSCSFQMYLAHALWTNWVDGSNRTKCKNHGNSTASAADHNHEVVTNWLEHSDFVMDNLVGLGDELSRFLSLPTSSRTYHRMLNSGRKDAAEIVEIQYRLFDSFYTKRMTNLTMAAEKLKTTGLGATEVSRIRQFEQLIGEAIEGLRIIKMYRTPQALRAFGRLFTLVLPPLYAPSFAELAFDLHSLPMGIIFSFITPLCLTALFESMNVLEDPFVCWVTLDGIDSAEEFEVLHFHQLKNARDEIFPHAEPFVLSPPTGSVAGETPWNKSSEIFDTTLLEGIFQQQHLPSLEGSFRLSSRISNHAKNGSIRKHAAADDSLCIDRSDRISHFAMDASARSTLSRRVLTDT